MRPPKPYLFHLMAVITIIIWGTTFVSTKVLINHGLTPVEILLYRFLIAYVCIWLISPKTLWANTWKDEFLLLLSGIFGGSLYFIAENTALKITMASNVSLIICTTPVLTTILTAMIYRKERLTKRLVAGSLIALAGVSLVVFNGSFLLKISPVGDLLTLAAAISWAFYCVILRKLSERYPTVLITRKVFFYGIITMLPVLIVDPVTIDQAVIFKPVVLANLLFLGIVASMFCYIMWNSVVKNIGTIRATNYLYIVPLVTMFTSSVTIHEPITLVAIFGAILILGGVYLAERR